MISIPQGIGYLIKAMVGIGWKHVIMIFYHKKYLTLENTMRVMKSVLHFQIQVQVEVMIGLKFQTEAKMKIKVMIGMVVVIERKKGMTIVEGQGPGQGPGQGVD